MESWCQDAGLGRPAAQMSPGSCHKMPKLKSAATGMTSISRDVQNRMVSLSSKPAEGRIRGNSIRGKRAKKAPHRAGKQLEMEQNNAETRKKVL